jgi:hypothetical protein
MDAIGHQRGGSNAASNPDPIRGNQLVTSEPHHAGDQHPQQIRDRLRQKSGESTHIRPATPV